MNDIDYWESEKSYLGLSRDEITKWISLTNEQRQQQISQANAINERYLFECEIAELREYRHKKCDELLNRINQKIVEYKNAM